MAEESMEPPKRKQLPNFAEQVFKIDLLREMILDMAIRENKEISLSSCCTLRLVQTSWLETITKLLEKNKKPFFNLLLNYGNSRNANVDEEEEEGKLLDRFTNAVMSSSLTTGPSVPAFSVKICECAFVAENHGSFSKMLVHCGTGLVELNVIPHEERLILMFPNFTLPNLRKLAIHSTFERSVNASHFINSLLNAAPSLKEFVVELINKTDQDFQLGLLDFQYFTLPPTITTLELGCYLTNANLEMLFKNELPLLNTLKLLIPSETSYPDGTLFRILDKFRATLTKVTLDTCEHEEPEAVSKLRFPIMEKLEEFSNLSINCHLEDDRGLLEGFLPKLSKLALTNQTFRMFSKWTEGSRFSSVEDLKVHLADQHVGPRHQRYWAGVDLERMQRVHLTFPSVRKLDITVNVAVTSGLKYLFQEMRQLTHLKIEAVGNGHDCNSWDAVLIGVPKSFVEGLRNSGNFWKRIQITADESPSMRDLQELTSLSLEGDSFVTSSDPLISDLTFHFALLQMPKLQELTLGVKFRASEEMAVKWKDQGRTLVYSEL